MYRSTILGTGHFLPEEKITNYDLEKLVDTNHDWIVERTGIHSRRRIKKGQTTSGLALPAAQEALKNAGISAKDLDMIVFATTSPDCYMPTSACYLQEKLEASKCVAFDVVAACSGFIYGLSIADQFIKTGAKKNVLVVGAEILTNFVDYTDRSTCILFGDGAGAAVLSRNEDEKSTSDIHSHHLYSDGSLTELLTVKTGGSFRPIDQSVIDEGGTFIKMNGREIFKHAVRAMSSCSKEALKTNDLTIDEIDWVIPHQANLRIIEATAKYLGCPMEKVVVEIEDMGNTSAATVVVSLDRAIKDGRIKRGQKVLLTAFGAGLTNGSILLTY